MKLKPVMSYPSSIQHEEALFTRKFDLNLRKNQWTKALGAQLKIGYFEKELNIRKF
jgi:hypothetical protein